MKKILTAIFLTALLLSCSSDDEGTPRYTFDQKIEAETFSLYTPEGWSLIRERGDDTYVGRITNDKLTIYFDQGFLAFRDLSDIEKTSETIFLHELEINGVPAVIEKTYRPDADTRLSVYLQDGDRKNRLYVLDSNDDDFFIQIFKTHIFK